MKLSRFLLAASIILSLLMFLMLEISVWIMSESLQNFGSRQFYKELQESTQAELEQQGRLFFQFSEHLIQNENTSENYIIEFFQENIHPYQQFYFFNMQGELLGNQQELSQELTLLFHDQLERVIEKTWVNDRKVFYYPDDFTGQEKEDLGLLMMFEILPEQNLVVALSKDFRLNLYRYRLFQEKMKGYSMKMLLWVSLIFLFLSSMGALLFYQLLSRLFITPLKVIEAGLNALRKKKFQYRLKENQSTELKSISEGFNQTAETLERSYREIEKREETYRTLIENLPQMVFLKDIDSMYISCNRAFAQFMGLTPEQVPGKFDKDFHSEELAASYVRDDKRIMASGIKEQIEEKILQEGRQYCYSTIKTPVSDNHGNVVGILGIVIDITKIKEKEETIRALNESLEQKVQERTRELEQAYKNMEELSTTDPLTGLHNRRYFNDRAQNIWNHCLRFKENIGLLMIDIDHFKAYNDAYGHLAGDEAIRNVAECLHIASRRSDDLAARYGGEEFVMIIPHSDEEQLQAVAEKILRMIRGKKLPHKKSPISDILTLSIGSFWGIPSEDKPLEYFTDQADKALYKAKEEGRNRYVAL